MSVRGTHVPEHLRLPIAGVTPPPTEKDGQRLFPTGNFRSFRPVYRDKTPPCNHACPTGEQIQKYLDFTKHHRYLDGYLAICEDNPMPAITHARRPATARHTTSPSASGAWNASWATSA
jgi:hypothetical protein